MRSALIHQPAEYRTICLRISWWKCSIHLGAANRKNQSASRWLRMSLPQTRKLHSNRCK